MWDRLSLYYLKTQSNTFSTFLASSFSKWALITAFLISVTPSVIISATASSKLSSGNKPMYKKICLPRSLLTTIYKCPLRTNFPPQGGDSHVQRTGCSSYLWVVKKAVLPPLRVSASKGLQPELLWYSFKVLSRKNMTGGNMLFYYWYLLGDVPHSKTWSWYLLEFFFFNWQQADPFLFMWESPQEISTFNFLGSDKLQPSSWLV